jgi:phage FluMu protein Com/uncharacterized membrane protein
MPIAFRCTGCQRLLRTADDSVGKPAKCPECGAIVTVPQPQIAPVPVERFTPVRIEVGGVFSRTWTIFKRDWTVCLVAFLVLAAIHGVIGYATSHLLGIVDRGADNALSASTGKTLVEFASSLVSTWIGIGQTIFLLNLARGRQVDFADIFRGGPYLVRGYLAGLLVMVIVIAGLFLCIIPGIIFALMLSQALFLIVDRDAGVFDSLSMSRELTSGNKATLLAIVLLAALFGVLLLVAIVLLAALLGVPLAVAMRLGFFVVAPCLMLFPAVTYLAMSGQPTADQRIPGGPSALPPSDETMPYGQS